MMDVNARLRRLYGAFNARDLDALLAAMTPDVDWPNAWEGGRLRGGDAVRGYWTRQWAQIDPKLELLAITSRPEGRVSVRVRQVVRSLSGDVLSDNEVIHVHELRDGLIARMTVEQPPGGIDLDARRRQSSLVRAHLPAGGWHPSSIKNLQKALRSRSGSKGSWPPISSRTRSRS